MGKTFKINDYLKLLKDDLMQLDLVTDRAVKKLMLNDYERKLQHISNEYSLKDSDMRLVREISVLIKKLNETLSLNVIRE